MEVPEKCIYQKPKTNGLNDKRLKTLYPLRSRTKKACPLLLLLFNIGHEVLARAVMQEEEIKDIQIGNEEVRLYSQVM